MAAIRLPCLYDDCPSDISACVSADEGLTWSEPETVLYARDFGTNNLIRVSLIRRRITRMDTFKKSACFC